MIVNIPSNHLSQIRKVYLVYSQAYKEEKVGSWLNKQPGYLTSLRIGSQVIFSKNVIKEFSPQYHVIQPHTMMMKKTRKKMKREMTKALIFQT